MIQTTELVDRCTKALECWLLANLERCSSVQAFGVGVEGWWQVETALHFRTIAATWTPVFAVERERTPASCGVTVQPGGPNNVDLLLCPAESTTGWCQAKGVPRLWLELKAVTHWSRSGASQAIQDSLRKYSLAGWTPNDVVLVAAWSCGRHHRDEVPDDPLASVPTAPVATVGPISVRYADYSTERKVMPYARVSHFFRVYRVFPT